MLRLLGIAMLSVGLLACSPQPAASGYDSDAVVADVSALIQHWSDAGEAGDWTAIADTYADAEGFAWIERGAVAYDNHDAIVAGLDNVEASEGRIVNDVSDIVVTPLDADVAAYRVNYRLEVTTAAFGYESSGVLSGVAIRQDGVWRLLQGSFSEQPRQE